MSLPNSHWDARYSIRFHHFGGNGENLIRPDEEIPQDWESYKEGRGPVLEWVCDNTAARLESMHWHFDVSQRPSILRTHCASITSYLPRAPRRILDLAPGYPWDDGTASEAELQDYAVSDLARWSAFAEKNHTLLVVPTLGRDHFVAFRDLEGGPVRPDGFLNLILDGPAKEKILRYRGRFSLHGHSAGGQFAALYLVAYPKRLEAVVLSAPSTYPVADPTVSWPYGEAQAECHTEEIAIQPVKRMACSRVPDSSNWPRAASSVPTTVIVGSLDKETRPPVPGNIGADRISRGRAWVFEMRQLARRHRHHPTVRFLSIPDLSHDEIAMARPAQKILENIWALHLHRSRR